jgi:predicted HicB family RNase H-like nuclease
VRQQREAANRIEGDRRSAPAHGRRAAFTLRVDAERHLKLRLACTLQGRSAQQLVTDALDALLNDLPEIADLAAQVARKRH